MGKVKNYLQEKAEEFMHEIEDKVSKGKMTKGCAYKLSVDRKDEIAFDLVGYFFIYHNKRICLLHRRFNKRTNN
jgi:hypothetical protein